MIVRNDVVYRAHGAFVVGSEIYAGRAKDSIPPVTEATPQFRDIHISNVLCYGAEEGIFVLGLPEMNIRDT